MTLRGICKYHNMVWDTCPCGSEEIFIEKVKLLDREYLILLNIACLRTFNLKENLNKLNTWKRYIRKFS